MTAIGFPAEKGKSRKLAVFPLKKRNREFESTPLRHRVLDFRRRTLAF